MKKFLSSISQIAHCGNYHLHPYGQRAVTKGSRLILDLSTLSYPTALKALALLSSWAALGGNITKRSRSTCTISEVLELGFWISSLTHNKKHALNQAKSPRHGLIVPINGFHNHTSSSPGGSTGFLLQLEPNSSARGSWSRQACCIHTAADLWSAGHTRMNSTANNRHCWHKEGK